MDKTIIAIIVLTVLVFGGIVGLSFYNSRNFQARNQCVEHSVGLSMHIHPELEIYFGDQKQTIPANIGIEPTCMKAIHTHEDTGKIHIEYPENHDFTLSDFFANWDQPFSKDKIMDKQIDPTHQILMTVDGVPNDQYEKLVLKDGQKIVIRYEEIKLESSK